MTFCFVTLNLFQGLSFYRLLFKNKEKQKMGLPRRMLTHPPRNGGCVQWRMVVPLRAPFLAFGKCCASCSRGSLKVIDFPFLSP